ncbi:MAG: hypothetical protein L0H19_08015, partial [Salinisphaera sp.]|nr:hypothetical protein [Salinisphaera sp.]
LLAAPAQPTLDHGPLGQLLRTLSEPEQENAYQWLRQRLGGAPRARRGVALIGLRGAGKTTLGKALAQSLSLPFFRLTDVIEQLGGMEIGELFALGGQKSYRRLERQALDHLLAQDRPLVIDVGGSLVSEPATFNLLRQAFVTVWLKADPQDHMDRVIRQGDTRPMEGNREAMADLRRILAEREHDYQKAHHVVQTSARSIDECVIELRAIATAHRSLDLPG